MDVRFKRDGTTLIVSIDGEIDHHTSRILKDRIDSKFIMEPVKNMIIDLARVTFMDSAGIGLIMGRMKRVSSVGGKMSIRHPKPEIIKILKMSNVDKLISKEA
ncbi:MAG: anti-sigma factor antagonist [Clostridiaceae bacterium]|jgi:stage II sporulation protein AA (anti-sigma F factor antagonist)|nr:anti-sigma factor antagonist [Clostridiaceae bacterium]